MRVESGAARGPPPPAATATWLKSPPMVGMVGLLLGIMEVAVVGLVMGAALGAARVGTVLAVMLMLVLLPAMHLYATAPRACLEGAR